MSGYSRSVVIPVYKSEDHIQSVFRYLEVLKQAVGEFEVVFVIDGSPDNSRQKIELETRSHTLKISVLTLSKNFGVGPAIHAALQQISTDAVVIVSCDLQEPVELFIEFFRGLEAGEADVFLGERMTRDDPLLMRITSRVFWTINRLFINRNAPRGGFDGAGLSARAREALISLPEARSNILLQLQWIGFRRVFVPFHRRARISGKSSWSFVQRLRIFSDSLYGFSSIPIAAMAAMSIIGLCIAVTVSSILILNVLLDQVQLSELTIVLLVGAIGQSVSIFLLGIIGGYSFRAFENSKGRPNFILDDVYEPLNK